MPEQIGVSLSGGGFRSTLFGIGALHFLAEAGLNEGVKVVSSVSGGGYANATLAASGIAYSAMTTDQFRVALLPVVSVL
ncbi:MAG: patatin-like phospholipase family protein, partial [Acidimicrobiia bacterium]|nr:patatin-like phospholipase family protein [Acidimicrobiia bacterium]